MRIRGTIVEYDLKETAAILGISQKELRKRVREGKLIYNNGDGYKFHDASLDENRRRLGNAQG